MRTNHSFLDTIDDAFVALSTSDPTIGIDGRSVHPGLPQRFIGARELRSVLLHPATTYPARDAALVELISRAKGDQDATLVVLGMVVPGLKRAGGRLARGVDGLNADIDAELVAGVLEALATGVGTSRVAAKLLTAAIRHARAVVRNEARNDVSRFPLDAGAFHTSNPEVALDRAVAAGVITQDEAELVAASRIDGRSTTELADEAGTTVGTLRTRRNRAERRLRDFLQERR